MTVLYLPKANVKHYAEAGSSYPKVMKVMDRKEYLQVAQHTRLAHLNAQLSPYNV